LIIPDNRFVLGHSEIGGMRLSIDLSIIVFGSEFMMFSLRRFFKIFNYMPLFDVVNFTSKIYLSILLSFYLD
jgi:hypothetical protein